MQRTFATDWGERGETLHTRRLEIPADDHQPDAGERADRLLERVFVHLRAHVGELRRLESTGAREDELEERRALIGQLQGHLAELVRDTLTRAG